MKTLIKLTLVLSLFGSVAFADGDMPGGGYQCPPEGCPPPCTVDCPPMAQQGGEEPSFVPDTVYTSTDVAIDVVRDTLDLLF